jgi:hypothetical protein
MKTETININARYYLQPILASVPNSYNVIDRALGYNHRPAVVFSNGTEKECREWVVRNCEEPVEHSPAPWKLGEQCRNEREKGELHYPIFWEDCGCCAHVFRKNDAALISTAPKLLALLEQYHAAMPAKESGALIAEAKGWVIE